MGDRDHWGAGWNGNGEGVRHYTNLTEESSSLSFKSPAFPSTLEAFWILAQPHPPPWLASLQRGNGHPQLAPPRSALSSTYWMPASGHWIRT
jgi:hypothetical protein